MDWQRPREPMPSFAQQVRARLATGERRGALIEHSTTPAILRMLGCPAFPLAVSPGVLFKIATGKGGQRAPLSAIQIQRLPELIDDPVAIFAQKGGTGWAILTSEQDAANNPILVCVRHGCLDGVRRINAITTAFGKDRARDWALRVAPSLRYRGTRENPRLPLPGLAYYQTGALRTEGCARTVLGEADLRKFRDETRAKCAA